MSEWIKKIKKSFLILTVLILLGLLSLIAVYSLPTEMNLNTLKSSVSLYKSEGIYPNWNCDKEDSNVFLSTTLDNFTDSIMLRNVIYPGSGSIVRDAILNPKFEYKNSNTLQSLIFQLEGKGSDYFISYYPRYWHGYLIVLKPLTCFLDVSHIRLLNLLLQITLTTYLTVVLSTDLGKGIGISYFLTYAFFNPMSLSMSFQFSSVFYVMTLITFLLLRYWKLFLQNNNYLYLFLCSGILTAFFDLLTYPLVTLGIPLTVLFVKLYYSDLRILDKTQAMYLLINTSLFWCIGYGGMYIGKWLLAWYITDISVVVQTLNQLQHRMSNYVSGSGGGQVITPIQAIFRNLTIVFNDPVFMALMLILVYSLYKLYKTKIVSEKKYFVALKFILRILMLLPFFWYFLLSNHSFVHSFFAYRTIAIFVFAEGCYITTCFKENSVVK